MRKHKKSIWDSRRKSIVFCSAVGSIVSLILIAVFSAFTYFFMDDMSLKDILCKASVAAGAFSGGFICGKFRRRNGLAEGLICAAVMYLAVAFTGFIITGAICGIKKLLLYGFCSAAGGVVGVNSKRPKKLY
jgi:putative membrane protein (TIGR04086 family)